MATRHNKKSQAINMRVPHDLLAEFDSIVGELRMNRSLVIKMLMQQFIDENKNIFDEMEILMAEATGVNEDE